MRWKLVIFGGLAFFAVAFLVSYGTGQIIHQGVLVSTYQETSEFWRPELRADPPDMAALMPMWISRSLLTSLIVAFVYSTCRAAWKGPGWRKGLQGGFYLGLFSICFGLLGWAGVFNLPDKIWAWWSLDVFLCYLPAGAVLGWLGEKLDPE